MRVIHAATTQPCYECRERADIVVARGQRLWYACWEHAPALLEHGGIIVGGDLEGKRR